MNLLERAANLLDESIESELPTRIKSAAMIEPKLRYIEKNQLELAYEEVFKKLKSSFDNPTLLYIDENKDSIDYAKINGLISELNSYKTSNAYSIKFFDRVKVFLNEFKKNILSNSKAPNYVLYSDIVNELNNNIHTILRSDVNAKTAGKNIANIVKSRIVKKKDIYRQQVKNNAEIKAKCIDANDALIKVSNGRFKFYDGGKGNARPIVIDTVNRLQLTLTIPKEEILLPILQQPTKLFHTLKTMFEEQYDKLINNRSTIDTSTVFNYKQDAIIAIDPSMLGDKTQEKAYPGFQAGVTMTNNCIIHFINENGVSLSDGKNFYNEVNYVGDNYDISDIDNITIYSKAKGLLNAHYIDERNIHMFFSIKTQDNMLSMESPCEYTFIGAFELVESGNTTKHASMKYAKYKPLELGETSVMSEHLNSRKKANLIETAILKLKKAGYLII